MKLYFDLRLGYLVSSPGQDTALEEIQLKSGDEEEVILQFGRSSDPTGSISIIEASTWTPENLAGGTVISLGVKEDGEYSDGQILAVQNSWSNDAGEFTYTAALDLNTTEINAALGRVDADAGNDLPSISCGIEVTFQTGGFGGWRSSVLPVTATLYHDILSGSEGTPTSADDPDDYLLKSDAASTANGYGASLIGIEDAGGLITATTVEGALAELAAGGGAGTVTSVAVSGSDGIEVDSGSPITTTGTIALGINASTLKSHLSLNNVENTALSTWAGSANITTLGTIVTGTVPAANVSGLGTLATQSGTFSGTSSGTNTGDQTNISGNAATVTTNANLTGHITSSGNAAVLGSFTVAQLSTALSDAAISGDNTGDQDLSGYVQTAEIDTLAELNAIITDATLIDTGDSRLSDARTPTAHASSHVNGADDIQSASASQKGLMTTAYASKLDGIEAAADVTDAANVASSVHGVSGKTTPVDADEIGLIDSAASNALKVLTWANLKATAKTYFDTLYNLYVLPVADTGTIGGVKRNTGTSLQFMTGIDSSGNLEYDTPPGSRGGFPIGAILPFGGFDPPADFLYCAGQDLSSSTYNLLAMAIGGTNGIPTAASYTVACTNTSTLITSSSAHGLSVDDVIFILHDLFSLGAPTGTNNEFVRPYAVVEVVSTTTFRLSDSIGGTALAATSTDSAKLTYDTFNAPDLRDRVVVGRGDMGGSDASVIDSESTLILASTFGEDTHTLLSSESGVPAHTHTVYGDLLGGGGVNRRTLATSTGAADQTSAANSAADASSAHNNLQPSYVLNYIICYQ